MSTTIATTSTTSLADPFSATARRRPSSLLVAVVVGSLAAMGLHDPAHASYVMLAAGLAVASLGLVVVSGWARQVSLCQYGFIGVGAYAASGLGGTAFPVRAAAGVLAAAAVAVPVGLAASRLRGLALGALTLLVGLTVWSLALTPAVMSGVGADTFLGVEGRRPSAFTDDRAYAILAVLIAVGALAIVLVLRTTRTGRAMAGLGTNRTALVTLGWNPRLLVVCSFAVAAAFGGLGGVLIAGGYGSLNANDIMPLSSIVLWAFLFNFGADRPAAAVLAPTAIAALSAAGVGGDVLAIAGAAGLIFAGSSGTRGVLNDLDDKVGHR